MGNSEKFLVMIRSRCNRWLIWKLISGKNIVSYLCNFVLLFCCFLLLYNSNLLARFSREISGNFGNFEISGNSGKCRKIFSGKIPGNFPPDFPAFSGDETHVTALILSFKKLKTQEISGNFGRKFPGNSGKFSPKNVGKFSPNFSAFFG